MATDLQVLRAEEIMTKALVCAHPQQDLIDAETMLIEHHISGVPVVEQGRLVGVLSRSDIARVQVLLNSLDGQVTDQMTLDNQVDGFQHAPRAEFQGFRQKISRLKVKDAMRDKVITCTRDTPAQEIAETMVGRHIHRVIVVDGDRPVGIVSSLDLVKLVAEPYSAYATK